MSLFHKKMGPYWVLISKLGGLYKPAVVTTIQINIRLAVGDGGEGNGEPLTYQEEVLFVSPNIKKIFKLVITCITLAEQSVEDMSSSSAAWVHCFFCKKSVQELKCAIYLTACGNTVCDSCRSK